MGRDQVITEVMGHIHALPHSYNQNILKKRVQEIDSVNKGNQSDIDQLKAELANAQYGKLSMSRVPTWKYSKES